MGVTWALSRALNGQEGDIVVSSGQYVRGKAELEDEKWFYVNGVMTGEYWLKTNVDEAERRFGRRVWGIHNRRFVSLRFVFSTGMKVGEIGVRGLRGRAGVGVVLDYYSTYCNALSSGICAIVPPAYALYTTTSALRCWKLNPDPPPPRPLPPPSPFAGPSIKG